jgi:hypothetical protein
MPGTQNEEEIENDVVMWGREELFENRNWALHSNINN